MTDQKIIQLLKDTGHLDQPCGGSRQEWNVEELASVGDWPVGRAIASYQDFHSECLDRFCLDHHSRPARADGDIGPATRDLFALPRCGHPDYGPDVAAATGSGNWRGCHGIGNYHSALVHVDKTDMPGFLRPHWDEALKLAFASFAEIGLKFALTDDESKANIIVTFETARRGWIGLAIVGSGQSCNSTIWAQFHAGYHPTKIVSMWTQLLMHEFGHNCGWQHTRGGVMSATLMVELPPTWIGDPIEPLAKRMYGGVPIPGAEPPEPGPPGQDRVGKIVWSDGSRGYDLIPEAEVP